MYFTLSPLQANGEEQKETEEKEDNLGSASAQLRLDEREKKGGRSASRFRTQENTHFSGNF